MAIEESYHQVQERIKQLRLQVEEIKSSNQNFSDGEPHLDNLNKGLSDIQTELEQTRQRLVKAISILENPDVNNLLTKAEKEELEAELTKGGTEIISLDQLTVKFENLLKLANQVIDNNNEDAKNKLNQATNDLQKIVEDVAAENKKLSTLAETYRNKIATLTEQTTNLKATSGKISGLSATLLLGVGSLISLFFSQVLKWTKLFRSKKNV